MNLRWYINLLLLILLGVISLPYWISDLWMDELVSLGDYWTQPNFWDIFMTYPMANNHILFSAEMWCWVRLVPDPTSEWWLRMPLMGHLLLLWLILWCHRNRFSQTYWLLILTFLLSPVLFNFLFQLRGYSLSLVLATLSTLGCIEMLEKNSHGFWKVFLGCVLLPGIMPTNGLFLISLWLFLGIEFWRTHESKIQWIKWCILAFGMGIGSFPYLCMGGKFFTVMQSPWGWENSWAALGNLFLGLFVHLFIPCMIWLIFCLKKKIMLVERSISTPKYWIWILLCIAGIVIPIFLRSPSPFPRVFLVFFPIFTMLFFLYLEALWNKAANFLTKNWTLFYLLIFLLHYFAVIDITNMIRNAKVAVGDAPQNLLEQYYRFSQDASKTIQTITATYSPDSIWLVADFHQWLALRHYGMLAGIPPERILDARNIAYYPNIPELLKQEGCVLWIASDAQTAFAIMPHGVAKPNRLRAMFGHGMYQVFVLIP